MSQHLSLPKDKIRFLLLEGVHQNAIDVLNAAGYTNIDYRKTALEGDALKEAIKDAHFIGIRSRTQLTEEVFEAANKLIAVGCFCIGTNQVNLTAAMERGIPVFNAPYSNTRSVAELVLAEAILLLRRVPEKSTDTHAGGWNKSAVGSFETRGKTLGIVGYGSIGSQLSVLAESLGMQVIYYDAVTKLPLGNARQVGSMGELHVPDVPSTRNFMAKEQFAQMKEGAIFINAARGTCVVIEDLADAIKSGHIAGAAVDVFPKEPKANGEEFVSPLRNLPNVILTPHVGGSTMEAQANIGLEVAEKFVAYSDKGMTLSAVNFPEIALPLTEGKHRLLHIHQNIPGVLSKINNLFAEHGINISGQSLMTKGDVGYLVMDVDATASKEALDTLHEVEGTIRVRVLF
jgi:D-3-phosphoglycerate dehydrogenase